MMTRDYAGPFRTPYWLYRLGFDWEEEFELEDGWARATWEIPAWAQSPTANIIGTWKPVRKRRVWLKLPIQRWQEMMGGDDG